MFGGRALSRDEAFCWGLRGLLALPGSSRGFEAQFRPSEHNARSPTAQIPESNKQAKHTPIKKFNGHSWKNYCMDPREEQ